MLSNTMVPKYYGEFRDSVLRGETRVCENISLQMNRIDDDIANPEYFYDPNAIDGYVRFCEAELTLTDGTDLTLLPTFKMWAEDLLSWYYYSEEDTIDPTTGRRITVRKNDVFVINNT